MRRHAGEILVDAGFSLVAVALVLVLVIVVLPWYHDAHIWWIGGDVWVPLDASRYVANGAPFHLYEPQMGDIGLPYPPGIAFLLAPFVWFGDHFNLTGSSQYLIAHPQMFWLVGPALAVAGTFPVLAAVRRVARAHSTRASFTVQLAAFLAIGWAPIVYFHPEDTIVCTAVLVAVLSAANDRWRAVGIALGLALLFKQWAVFPALPFVLGAPRGKRSVTGFYAFGVPALVMAPFLLATPHATWHSLTGSQASLAFGHQQLWTRVLFGGHLLANVTVLRALWGLGAVGVALLVRRSPTPDRLLAAAGTIMLARLALEPNVFAYYLVPAAVLAIAWSARAGRPVLLRGVTAAVLGGWCISHWAPALVWWAVFAAGMAYVCGPMSSSLFVSAQRGDDINDNDDGDGGDGGDKDAADLPGPGGTRTAEHAAEQVAHA